VLLTGNEAAKDNWLRQHCDSTVTPLEHHSHNCNSLHCDTTVTPLRSRQAMKLPGTTGSGSWQTASRQRTRLLVTYGRGKREMEMPIFLPLRLCVASFLRAYIPSHSRFLVQIYCTLLLYFACAFSIFSLWCFCFLLSNILTGRGGSSDRQWIVCSGCGAGAGG
jgi:hypothetical protein